MIYVDIDSFQTGQCEECGCRTYRVVYVASYSFYLCNACAKKLYNALICDSELLSQILTLR